MQRYPSYSRLPVGAQATSNPSPAPSSWSHFDPSSSAGGPSTLRGDGYGYGGYEGQQYYGAPARGSFEEEEGAGWYYDQDESPLTPRPHSSHGISPGGGYVSYRPEQGSYPARPTYGVLNSASAPVRRGEEEWEGRQWMFPEPQIAGHSISLIAPSPVPSPSTSATHLHPHSQSVGGRPSTSPGGSPASRSWYLQHRASRSELGPLDHHTLNRSPSGLSVQSLQSESSIGHTSMQSWESASPSTLSHELSNLSIDWESNLERFQNDELAERDEEWHRLVSTEAREALPKKEVQRQSVIFEIIKSEKEYVSDLLIIREVFINPLLQSNIISPQYMRGFCKEVFYNLDEILRHHQRMLAALFERQREEHPLIQSLTDIVLDNSLRFRPAYDTYIKHYPLSEAQHRRELRRNPAYHTLLQTILTDPRTRKRDLITFISRPVTRLPRLNLLLEQLTKLTEPDHPDADQLPAVTEFLSDFIKSTQPGIAAAEGKVKFWSLIEGLVFRSGERIDMDAYNENRSLVKQGILARRQRSETDWHGWHDLEVSLLDNFILLCRREEGKSGVRHIVTSRPIPLEYLRLGAFDGPAESRKMKPPDGGPLSALSFHYEPYYPFTIYHASSKRSRRYTLFAASDDLRKKWFEALKDALEVRKVQQESNMFYVLSALNDGFFKIRTNKVTVDAKAPFPGRISCAATFRSGNNQFYTVAAGNAVYAAARGMQDARLILHLPNTQRMSVLQEFNKLILQCDLGVLSYSLDLLARAVIVQLSHMKNALSLLEASMERVTPRDESIGFFRTGVIADRTLVVYTVKRSFMQTNVHALEVLSPIALTTVSSRSSHRSNGVGSEDGRRSFRSFGSPFYVPKDALEITVLRKTIAISTEKGLIIVDPTHLAQGAVGNIPEFTSTSSTETEAAGLAGLKARCEAARALGIVPAGESELMIIYDDFGCYVTKHGLPCRKCEIIRWETTAMAYSFINGHLILVSRDFLEVRDVATGRLMQVMEGQDFRLLHSPQNSSGISPPAGSGDKPLIAVKGDFQDEEGQSDALMELIETAPLER